MKLYDCDHPFIKSFESEAVFHVGCPANEAKLKITQPPNLPKAPLSTLPFAVSFEPFNNKHQRYEGGAWY